MMPALLSNGLLPSGEHQVTWEELRGRFGGSFRRQDILAGVRLTAVALKHAGCQRMWVDGSFVTAKHAPSDWDGCWDAVGVDFSRLDPVLLPVTELGRKQMKQKFRGDIFPASIRESASGLLFLNFFQVDKATGQPKGILALDLNGWNP